MSEELGISREQFEAICTGTCLDAGCDLREVEDLYLTLT